MSNTMDFGGVLKDVHDQDNHALRVTVDNAITLSAGSNITLTPSGNNITISSTGGGGGGNIASINGDTTAAQTLSVGTAGSDFAIVDAGGGSHVFNLPTASASNRGALASADWSHFNIKVAVSKYTLTPTDITNKFVTLPDTPATPTLTLLTVIGGPMQNYGVDYTVSTNQLGWSGLSLDGVLVSGDILIIESN